MNDRDTDDLRSRSDSEGGAGDALFDDAMEEAAAVDAEAAAHRETDVALYPATDLARYDG